MNTSELNTLLEELCACPQETAWLEFKQNFSDPVQIGEYISALSNGACLADKLYGYLVWGVHNDTHEITGTSFKISSSRHGNQDLELWLRTFLHPKVHFDIFEFDYYGKALTILKIPAAVSEPTHFQKKPFIRINSQKTDLRNHPALIRKIYNAQEDWSAKVCKDASLGDLDTAAINLARTNYAGKNEKYKTDILQWDDASLLDKMKITVNGEITNTALLLLGKAESTNLLLPAIGQITWKLDTEEQAYEHFSPPFLLNVSALMKRIRNIRYKIFPDTQLVAAEVLKYEPRVILEALNNCIAHQDYHLNSRIIVTEKTEKLIFTNVGSFYEGRAEDYSLGEKTPQRYRNPWLAQAMVNLNMIDTMGYGIHTMYKEQRKRYFPLPDYSKSEADKVVLEIYGQVLNINYSKLLLEKTDLALSTVIMLDRMQKKLPMEQQAYDFLKKQGLAEGRKPNYHIAGVIAGITGQKADYIKNRGFKDNHYKQMLLDFIEKYKQAGKQDIDNLLKDILPGVLDEKQRSNKVHNLLYAMSRKDKSILNTGTNRKPVWIKPPAV
ncbi:MAG: putative DNA binding domain-containing protein [Ferruginibacter sp.]|nr:putative DNA binding domain-containing protein [Ferruginibacter sp.]